MAQPHHPKCNLVYRRHSGFVQQQHDRFIVKFQLQQNAWSIDCLGCCLAYLVNDRGYTSQPICAAIGDAFLDRVVFNNDPNNIGVVNCFVRESRRRKNGQLAVVNLGDAYAAETGLEKMSEKPVASGHTYQLYSQPQANLPKLLSLGIPVQARIELVAINKIAGDELGRVYLNYADAALLERYRETRKPRLGSLTGRCNAYYHRDAVQRPNSPHDPAPADAASSTLGIENLSVIDKSSE